MICIKVAHNFSFQQEKSEKERTRPKRVYSKRIEKKNDIILKDLFFISLMFQLLKKHRFLMLYVF